MEWNVNETLSFALVGLGWLIAITCILRKHKSERTPHPCLVGDIITATFATITVVLVIDISFSVYIDLRSAEASNVKLLEVINEKDRSILQLQSEKTHLDRDRAKLSGEVSRLSDENERLREEIVEVSANNTTIAEEFQLLWANGEWDSDEGLESIRKHFGADDAIQVYGLAFSFFVDSTGRITCILYDSGSLNCEL